MKTSQQGEPDEAKLPLVEKAYAAETVPAIKEALGQRARRHAAGQRRQGQAPRCGEGSLGESGTPATKTLLLDRQKVETDTDVQGRHRQPRWARSSGGSPGASAWA